KAKTCAGSSRISNPSSSSWPSPCRPCCWMRPTRPCVPPASSCSRTATPWSSCACRCVRCPCNCSSAARSAVQPCCSADRAALEQLHGQRTHLQAQLDQAGQTLQEVQQYLLQHARDQW